MPGPLTTSGGGGRGVGKFSHSASSRSRHSSRHLILARSVPTTTAPRTAHAYAPLPLAVDNVRWCRNRDEADEATKAAAIKRTQQPCVESQSEQDLRPSNKSNAACARLSVSLSLFRQSQRKISEIVSALNGQRNVRPSQVLSRPGLGYGPACLSVRLSVGRSVSSKESRMVSVSRLYCH